MSIQTKYIAVLFLAVIGHSYAQESNRVVKARKNFENREYSKAIRTYDGLVKKGRAEGEVLKNLGDAHYFNADYVAASYCYGKLFELSADADDGDHMYRYAQTLKSSKSYEESNQWMDKFAQSNKSDQRALKYVKNRDYLSQIREHSGKYTVESLSINSNESDFAPSYDGKSLIFSTARDTGSLVRNVDLWNGKSFLNLYEAEENESGDFTNAKRLSKALNKKTHESSTAFSKDGNTLYFTRNNSNKGHFSRDDEGVSRLKLYRATLEEDRWENIEELPFNGDSYSVAHPTLSADEKYLYFASDMPGTLGASDIFMVRINEDGSFGEPKNLGPTVNTEARETFPFMGEDQTLYFASDGHPGLGGLDVFATKLNKGKASTVVNLGEPINSEQDDFSFMLIPSKEKGFFASNRAGGQGDDDIYGFTQIEPLDLECKNELAGIAKDEDTGLPLEGVTIRMTQSDGTEVASTVSDASGSFTITGDCATGKYALRGDKEGYEYGSLDFTMSGEETQEIAITLAKAKGELAKQEIGKEELGKQQVGIEAVAGTDLIKYLNLEPIYFDFDESTIRPDAIPTLSKVIGYMQQYPNVKILVNSHTDAVATNQYNDALSERRAKATIAYLVSKGISSTRLSGKGYGERRLVNDCTSKSKCDSAGHQLNRRSEFIVKK